MEKGLISTVQSYAIKDGPGIRSTVFCVGCNLRCVWCSNPELMLPGKKTMRFELAGETEREEVGYEIESRTLAERLARDKAFYDASGGGVTFSGGEAALQGGFVIETANYLKEMGIGSALDTAGDVPWESLSPVADTMDWILYDIKAFDGELHRNCTGRDNRQILDNLRRLAQENKSLIVRLVIVPGYNDDLRDVQKRLEWIGGLGQAVKRVDLLPYHTLGKGKYERLGLRYSIEGERRIAAEYYEKAYDLAKAAGVRVQVI